MRAIAIEYTCTKFGVDSSRRFPVRGQTDQQTDVTELPINAGGYAGVGNNYCSRVCVHIIVRNCCAQLSKKRSDYFPS